MKNMRCPHCEKDSMEQIDIGEGRFIQVCEECPNVMFEFSDDRDIVAVGNYLQRETDREIVSVKRKIPAKILKYPEVAQWLGRDGKFLTVISRNSPYPAIAYAGKSGNYKYWMTFPMLENGRKAVIVVGYEPENPSEASVNDKWVEPKVYFKETDAKTPGNYLKEEYLTKIEDIPPVFRRVAQDLHWEIKVRGHISII